MKCPKMLFLECLINYLYNFVENEINDIKTGIDTNHNMVM